MLCMTLFSIRQKSTFSVNSTLNTITICSSLDQAQIVRIQVCHVLIASPGKIAQGKFHPMKKPCTKHKPPLPLATEAAVANSQVQARSARAFVHPSHGLSAHRSLCKSRVTALLHLAANIQLISIDNYSGFVVD